MRSKLLGKWFVALLLALAGATSAVFAAPQTTAFTYQGHLNAGGSLPDNDTYAFTFTLFDASTAGTQIGAPIAQDITVVHGLFTADLDFGPVFGPTQRWLEVRVNGEALTPRQPVMTAPVAQYALNAPAGPTGPQGPAGPQGPQGPAGTITLPYSASQANAGPLLALSNTNGTDEATAVQGTSGSTDQFATAIIGKVSSSAPGRFSSGVRGINNGTGIFGTGVWGSQGGSGVGVHGEAPGGTGVRGSSSTGVGVSAASTSGTALSATSITGRAADFGGGDASNSANVLQVSQSGTGDAADFNIFNASSSASVLQVSTVGSGAGIYATSAGGTGVGAVVGRNDGGGYGLRGFITSNTSGSAIGVLGQVGISGSKGRAGRFENLSSANSFNTVEMATNGTGHVLVINHAGASGDLGIFQTNGANVARISRAGKGFFNGGTQTGGADLAEFVPTTGATPQPGEVVEIDPDHPDSFRLSSEAASPRVAGVISTDPGVALNARHGAEQAGIGPALALAGRVPVKVTNEGGAIHIGDLLVSARTPGHAMRAPEVLPPGTLIGKALQASDEADAVIVMLVRY